MIVTEQIEINKRKLKRTYSDTNNRIRQIETGIIYDEAVDVLNAEFTYEETEEMIAIIEIPEDEQNEPKHRRKSDLN